MELTEKEKILSVDIEDEMKNSYIDYAMSVIVGRALPDVRDGLKPVHRRILYAMKERGWVHERPYVKSAKIVGEVIGNYHPHGDAAVYDSLVRMVQDFSLRYPLIDGQGNFGCFTKDTKVRLSDGRNVNFEELVKEAEQGKRNYTFTFNSVKQKIEISEVKNPRLTRKKAKIIRAILDNGQEIKCTPDHLFMLRGGSYKKARELKPNDSLMPLYTKLYDGIDDPNLKGYQMLYQPLKNTWEFAHHLADQWNLEKEVYKKNAGKIRHHKDFNKLNNNPDNIQRIQWNQHWQLHREITEYRHRNDTEYIKKIAEARRIFWDNPINRKRQSKILSKRNKENWQNLDYRRKMSEVIRSAWQSPGYRNRIIDVSRKNLKALWKKKEFQELLSKLKSKELKKRWQNQDYRDFIAKITRQTSLRIWSNPQHKEYISQLGKNRWKDSNYRDERIKNLKRMWEKPEFRNKYPADHFSKMAKKLWGNPLIRKLHQEKAKKQWENPEFRTRFINGVIKSRQKQLQENPYLMQELTRKAKISLRKKWKDPLYKEKVIKNKILGFVTNLLKTEQQVTPKIYKEKRISGLPNMETALRYFNSFDEIISQAKEGYNHKVIAIEVIDEKEDVYDLTVEPWHNFALASGVFVHNSIDGDPPAAYRYTEARLASLASEILVDIDKDTVDFTPTFDGSMEEPVVLPSAIPDLLINGSSGIAVGMATNVPPHNMSEVIDALVMMIDNPDIAIDELMKIIKGPDFPQGAIIFGRQGIKDAYLTGRGSIKLRAKVDVEEISGHREAIIIKELPYQVNKAQLLETIALLVRDKKIEGVGDLRDESDREGTRVVIELKRDANAQIILNQLFKHTQLETSFGIIMLALVDNRPQILNLKQILYYYLDHRKTVVTRRTSYDLKKAEARAHILEGLKTALDNLNKVIKVIRDSQTPEVARAALMKNFNLSKEQAQAILDMRLQQLTGLETEKIDAEYLELIKKIALLKSILLDPRKLMNIIKDELIKIKDKYGDNRRTKIIAKSVELDVEDLIKEEDAVVTISHFGYIKRLPATTYRSQHRGGRGITGVVTKEDDFVEDIFVTSTHNYMLFFTNLGRVYWLKVYEIPEATRQSKGKAIVNLLNLSSNEENISAAICVEGFDKPDTYLLMVTQNGIIKKTPLVEYGNPRKGGIIAINLDKNDSLIGVKMTDGKEEIIIGTKKGIAIHFKEEDVRSIGRTGRGVIGIRLPKGDEVIGMEVVRGKETFLTATENGYGKRTPADKYRLQSRGGKGVINIKTSDRNGMVIGIKRVGEKDDIVLMTAKGIVIRQPVKDISIIGRNTLGVRLIRLDSQDKLMSISRISPEEEEATK